MIGVYFSGTGNSKYALEFFLSKYDKTAKAYTIEDKNITSYIKNNEEYIKKVKDSLYDKLAEPIAEFNKIISLFENMKWYIYCKYCEN